MLCELAHRFPLYAAALLERDLGLTRNFREESVTDLLMASVVGLEAFGVSVQFPIEPITGGDMCSELQSSASRIAIIGGSCPRSLQQV